MQVHNFSKNLICNQNDPRLLPGHVDGSSYQWKYGEWEHVLQNGNIKFKYTIAWRFISASYMMKKWRYRHCLHHICWISIFRRFLRIVIEGPIRPVLTSYWCWLFRWLSAIFIKTPSEAYLFFLWLFFTAANRKDILLIRGELSTGFPEFE